MTRTRGASRSESLEDQVLHECAAMVEYALASGLKVPATVLRTVDMALAAREERQQSDRTGTDSPPAHHSSATPCAHCAHAHDLSKLGWAHEQLAILIAPASPRTILLLSDRANEHGYFGFLGPVRIVRHMLVAGIVSLVTFIGLATSPEVTRTSGDIFESSGFSLLLNELFFLAAAGVGAAFAALFKAHEYISNGTYDPKYESSYWVRFALGLLAGVLLADLIPVGEGEGSNAFAKPLLALLGGFSAAVVYRILDVLVQTVESLVKGDSRAVVDAQEQAAKARNAERATQDRMELAAALMRLQDQLVGGATPDGLRQEINRVLRTLIPADRLDLNEVEAPAGVTTVAPTAGAQPAAPRVVEPQSPTVAVLPAPS